MKIRPLPPLRKICAALSIVGSFVALSAAHATVITWNLNPGSTDASVGSTTQAYSSSGYSIAASGFTTGFPSTPLGLYYVNQGGDTIGLGVASTSDHQLQGNGFFPAQFIQLNVSSLLSQGFTDGKLQVGSVGSSDTFAIWGQTTLTGPATQIGGTYNSSSDMQYISISNFSNYAYISIGAITGGVLAASFQATYSYVPEMSALFPILTLILAVSITQVLRRRRSERAAGNIR